MMRNRAYVAAPLLAAVFAGLSVGVATQAGELDETEFHRLHTLLRPADEEPWRTIPWKIDLLDAQRTAAERRQPIFIWAMDGHPLGCT